MVDVQNTIINRHLILECYAILCETIGGLKYRLRRKKGRKKGTFGTKKRKRNRQQGFPMPLVAPRNPKPRMHAEMNGDLRQTAITMHAKSWQFGATLTTTQELEKQPGEGVMVRLSRPWTGRTSWLSLWLDYLGKAAAPNCKPRCARSWGPSPERGWPLRLSLLDKSLCRPLLWRPSIDIPHPQLSYQVFFLFMKNIKNVSYGAYSKQYVKSFFYVIPATFWIFLLFWYEKNYTFYVTRLRTSQTCSHFSSTWSHK